jgi:ubiquinone/menaquinone biosynthesis C-methylase UbiE
LDTITVAGVTTIMDQGMDPDISDEIMGQGGRIILGRINLTRIETDDKLLMMYKEKTQLFDEWPEAYDRWFSTPIGSLVRRYEVELILDLLKPKRGETILDAGCGTGVFTREILLSGSRVVGLDISSPMLIQAGKKLKGFPFQMVLGDMLNLPFRESSFDKVVSVTALEFIEVARDVVGELFRVTERGGAIVVATLNSLSPWALRRKAEAKERHTIFEEAIFRSPDELRSLASVEGVVKTAIHFQKEDDPEKAVGIEQDGQRNNLNTGAFVAVRWQKLS